MRRRAVVFGIIGAVLAAAGCATARAATAPRGDASAPDAGIYVQVLDRYLGTPTENSFPDKHFPTVYVLDHTYPDAADPMGKHGDGTPLPADTQRTITAAVPGVTFVADRNAVVDTVGGCARVKNGGILITLGPVHRTGDDGRVGLNGFVACLGATWLTYLLRNEPGAGWRVTGIDPVRAIA